MPCGCWRAQRHRKAADWKSSEAIRNTRITQSSTAHLPHFLSGPQLSLIAVAWLSLPACAPRSAAMDREAVWRCPLTGSQEEVPGDMSGSGHRATPPATKPPRTAPCATPPQHPPQHPTQPTKPIANENPHPSAASAAPHTPRKSRQTSLRRDGQRPPPPASDHAIPRARGWHRSQPDAGASACWPARRGNKKGGPCGPPLVTHPASMIRSAGCTWRR